MNYLTKELKTRINTILRDCTTKTGKINISKLNKFLPENIHFSSGNLKYVSDERIDYAIFNIPAVVTCPKATVECMRECYARKAEKRFPAVVLGARMDNLYLTNDDHFAVWMVLYIIKRLQATKKAGKELVFRIHEAGDFYSLEYFKKWMAVFEYFKTEPAVRFGAYTKSSPFLIAAGYKHTMFKNVTINGSVWSDTAPERLQEYKAMNLPTYTALPAAELEKRTDIFKCECAGCGSSCVACFRNYKKYAVKAVAIH